MLSGSNAKFTSEAKLLVLYCTHIYFIAAIAFAKTYWKMRLQQDLGRRDILATMSWS